MKCIPLSECLCRECRNYRWLVASVKAFQAERGPVEFDWADLEAASRKSRGAK